VTFIHTMPFGAAVTPAGIRFRLWAPAATRVEVRLEDHEPAVLPMHPAGDGWWELLTAAARPGSRYRLRIDGTHDVPDPCSRFQPDDVAGPSAVVDPAAFRWRHTDWRGRPWHEAVFYELHVGCFSPEGTFEGVRRRLEHLADLGVTAIELMPIADFPGRRNWGYDGVLPFAPDSAYGTPDDLKRLVDDAHGRGMMMFLDVVYNHFGPSGNYLHLYAPQFFAEDRQTPWGAAIDYGRREVRDFAIHNALYWLEEYRFDGLRLDAVHAIADDSSPDILEELAETVHRHIPDRHVHLVLENDHNAARYLIRRPDGTPRWYVAQWTDDIHHALHVLATGERAGYYEDYADRPADHLARCLTEGFAYQGEPSPFRDGAPRGEPSADLPATAFVPFLQNHDQVGNRAFGERLSALADPDALEALTTVLLLAPGVPMLFMGQEWGALTPFLYFCDFQDGLADAVRDGRRREFARFPAFRDEAARERIPDPNASDTFARSRLDWSCLTAPGHAGRLAGHRRLLALRRDVVTPRLATLQPRAAHAERFGAGGLAVVWRFADGARLSLVANLASGACDLPPAPRSSHGPLLHATHEEMVGLIAGGELPAWSAAWFLA